MLSGAAGQPTAALSLGNFRGDGSPVSTRPASVQLSYGQIRN